MEARPGISLGISIDERSDGTSVDGAKVDSRPRREFLILRTPRNPATRAAASAMARIGMAALYPACHDS